MDTMDEENQRRKDELKFKVFRSVKLFLRYCHFDREQNFSTTFHLYLLVTSCQSIKTS